MDEMGEDRKLIRTLRWRLQQAYRIAEAAETCSAEGCSSRLQRMLEDVEELVRDAGHLVQASLMMQHVGLDPSSMQHSASKRLEEN